jgi:hypothetical protein
VTVIYLYALTSPAPAALPRRGLGGRPLRAVTTARVTAIVEDVVAPPPATRAMLERQQRLVAAIARRTRAILPARFGSTLTGEPAVRELMRRHAATLATALALVRHRVQMTLRSFGVRRASPPPPIRQPRGRTGRGTRYLLDRRRREAARTSAPELAAIRSALGTLVAAERIDRLDALSAVIVYHLIPVGRHAEYRRIVRRAAAAVDGIVIATGPWAPYAFTPALLS